MNNWIYNEKDLFVPLQQAVKEGKIENKFVDILGNFYREYRKATAKTLADKERVSLFQFLLSEIMKQLEKPHPFSLYHEKIDTYHAFGLSFVKPLIDWDHSILFGKTNLLEIDKRVQEGENVILLANHQSELDPQIIDCLIAPLVPNLGKNMIFVAGERVITDPAAVPFSLGRNLLCIYSKKYIDYPPEKKAAKQSHNQKTMRKMKELLDEGGKVIYVAPSGGRDRINAEGNIIVSPFDPNSIELFYLMARKALKKTHFYPLALHTYELLPPPADIRKEIGEERHAQFTPIFLSFGEEIEMETFSNGEKKERKKNRAEAIHQRVEHLYKNLRS